MKPPPELTEEQIKLHNDLYARANELSDGLIILDEAPQEKLGFFQKRRLRKAIELYQHVIEVNPANWQSMFFIGKAFQSLGELDQAFSWFARAKETVPDNPSVAKEYGGVAGQLGKHEIAIRALETVAMQHPNDAGLQTNFGLSCLMGGKLTHACKAFERIVELEPQSDVNKKLLALAREVESGKRPCPKTEADILRAI
jgi:tetratricopeptide (TPR) repeat protein